MEKPAGTARSKRGHGSASLCELANKRLETLKFWVGQAKLLEKDEVALHANLPEHAKCILKPKRLLLWKRMMEFYGYHDTAVFDEVVKGVELVGPTPFC